VRLQLLARFCYQRRRTVVAAWIGGFVLINVLSGMFAADATDNFELPGTDSQAAYDTLDARFPREAGDGGRFVFVAPSGIRAPAVRAQVEEVLAGVASVQRVLGVQSPYDPDAQSQISRDGTIAFAPLFLDIRSSDLPRDLAEELKLLADITDTEQVTVEAGGPVIELAEEAEPGGSELIGLSAAIIILLIAFGSLLAMGLPIVTALFGIGVGLATISLLGHLLDVPSFAPQIGAMIGIGVGIDYALFIVTRYRTALAHGKSPEDAVVEATTTAGRAVIFAGTVVVLALMGMLVMNFVLVRGLAVAASSVVAFTMVGSVTLLPALLGFAGLRIDRFKIPLFHGAVDAGSVRTSMWFRWSRVVQRRPWPVALIGAGALIVLTLPLFSMRLGVSDAGNRPEDKTSRRAYDLLAEGFGPGFNGPLIIVADLASSGPALVEQLAREVTSTEGVAFVTPPRLNDAGDTAVLTVFPSSAPQDPETDDLVSRLRTQTLPSVAGSSDVEIHVGGVTATFADFNDKIGERLPWFIAVVIALAFVLLTAVFRSPLVSLKAAILNLLSISAAYGVIVAVFQWGWGASLIGVGQPGPIESWVPMMMFAILFGLSMDYEVFLISRIREEYLKTGDNALAVADGLASTARVITAAAAIMISVFLSFVFGADRVLKLVGLGLATAIFVDATIVRLVLVPSTMELLGDRNWWLPRWLERLLPRLHVDGEPAAAEALEPAEQG